MRTMITKIICAWVVMTLAAQAYAKTVVPMKRQIPEQIQAATTACQAQVKSACDQALAIANQAFSACMSGEGDTISP